MLTLTISMAKEGTKFVVIMKDTDNDVSKTINVTNCQDSITSAQVNAFVAAYGNEYTSGTWALSTCYYEDTVHRGLGTNA